MRKRVAQWLVSAAAGGFFAAVIMTCTPSSAPVVTSTWASDPGLGDREAATTKPITAAENKPVEFVPPPHVVGPIDREVRSALRFTATHGMAPPRWGPDLSGSENNRKKYAAMTAGWGPEHYVSILHFGSSGFAVGSFLLSRLHDRRRPLHRSASSSGTVVHQSP